MAESAHVKAKMCIFNLSLNLLPSPVLAETWFLKEHHPPKWLLILPMSKVASELWVPLLASDAPNYDSANSL
jgi:hypothetical protein